MISDVLEKYFIEHLGMSPEAVNLPKSAASICKDVSKVIPGTPDLYIDCDSCDLYNSYFKIPGTHLRKVCAYSYYMIGLINYIYSTSGMIGFP